MLAILHVVLLLVGPIACVHGDLDMELYRKAMKSSMMSEVSLDGLDALIGESRPAPTVIVMFHDHSCKICQAALPELDRIAESFHQRNERVHIAHMECSKYAEAAKRRAHLQGFPSLLVWRARPEAIAEEDEASALIGQTLTVTADKDRLLRAARLAGMGQSKDAQRLQASGKAGKVLNVDLADSTAQLAFEEVGLKKAWLPLETLHRENGRMLPYRRADAGFPYMGQWQREDLLPFLENMLVPLVAPVGSARWAPAVTQGERFPSFVFCGAQVTRGFEEVAAAWQGKQRAFHAATPAACPSEPKGVALPQVVVYSPAAQQYVAGGKVAKDAVAIAGPEIVEDDNLLVEWVKANRFPGLFEIGFHSFAEFIHVGRPVVIACRHPLRKSPANEVVEKSLKNLAKPQALSSQIDAYTYSEQSFLLGVADGSMDGFRNFGVSPHALPHVVVFQGQEWWEDNLELRLATLEKDLQKLPQLWRFDNGLMSSPKWYLREAIRSYNYYDALAVDALGGGAPSRLAMPSLMVLVVGLNMWQLFVVGRSIVRAVLLEPEAETPGAEGDKKDQ